MPLQRLAKARVGYDGYRYQPPERESECAVGTGLMFVPLLMPWMSIPSAMPEAWRLLTISPNSRSGGPSLNPSASKPCSTP